MRPMYRLRKKQMGSVKVRVKGRMKTMRRISLLVMPSASSSGSHFRLVLPVNLRMRTVRR